MTAAPKPDRDARRSGPEAFKLLDEIAAKMYTRYHEGYGAPTWQMMVLDGGYAATIERWQRVAGFAFDASAGEEAANEARDKAIAERDGLITENEFLNDLKNKRTDERDAAIAYSIRLREQFQRFEFSQPDGTGCCVYCGGEHPHHEPGCQFIKLVHDATPAGTEALARRDARIVRETIESACVIARLAQRAGEGCSRDGGCNHVPCITARQIEHDIRLLATTAGEETTT